MIEAIGWAYLVAIGIVLIGLEVFVFSFFLFFIGLGFIVTAMIGFIYEFQNGESQVAVAFVVALVLIFMLRRVMVERFMKPQKGEQSTFEAKYGYVRDGAIVYEGTFWQCDEDLGQYKENERVEIERIENNRVILKK